MSCCTIVGANKDLRKNESTAVSSFDSTGGGISSGPRSFHSILISGLASLYLSLLYSSSTTDSAYNALLLHESNLVLGHDKSVHGNIVIHIQFYSVVGPYVRERGNSAVAREQLLIILLPSVCTCPLFLGLEHVSDWI